MTRPMCRLSARLEHRLHKVVLTAAARLADQGLRERVLDAEHTLWHGVEVRRAASLAEVLTRPWVDEHGITHCPTCGGLADRTRPGTGIPACTCPTRKPYDTRSGKARH